MQGSFFDIEECYLRLDKAGDPLNQLDQLIDWEDLRPVITPLSHESDKTKGGRPGWDPLLIVKCLILQSLYNISDQSCEYQINDRLSFKRFLGLQVAQKAPDEKTLWHYRERIKYKELDDVIFNWFNNQLEASGYAAEAGQIVDASFIPTHKPSGKHKKQLGDEIPLTPAQDRQIDKDATFSKKGGKTYHGYKNHIQVDSKNKIIRKQSVTTASTHDSQAFEALVTLKEGDEIWADSAYRSRETEEKLAKNKLKSQIHERAYRNKPLNNKQKANNHKKSKIRVRVEHVFGHMCMAMGGLAIHTIGLARAKIKNTFKNLAYNMQRFVFLKSLNSQGKCA